MRKLTLAAIGAALLVGGIAIGRYSTPTRRESVVVDREVTSSANARAVAYVSTSAVRTSTRTRTLTKWVQVPGRTEVTQDTSVDTGTASTTTTAAQQQETRVEYREKVRIEKQTVESAKTQWHASAMAGLSLDKRAAFGGGLEGRALGPVWIGLHGMKTKDEWTALMAVGLEW